MVRRAVGLDPRNRPSERGRFHHQVVLDQPYLVGVDNVAAHHHLLDASVCGHLEGVQRTGEVERHHRMPVSVDVLLRCLGHGDGRERDQDRGDRPLQGAESTGQRNGLTEHFSRRPVAQCLPGSLVQLSRDRIQLGL